MPLLYGFLGGTIIFLVVAGIILINYASERQSLLKFSRSSIDFKKQTNTAKWAKMLGINVTEYKKWCRILKVEPNFNKHITLRFACVALFLVGFIIGAVTLNLAILGITLFITILLYKVPLMRIQDKANRQTSEFSEQLPRFLDLLEIAMAVEMPVTEAIKRVAQSIGGVLGEELLECLAENEIGGRNWQDGLVELAHIYDDEDFSDFALDLIASYEKGNKIVDTIRLKSAQIKEARLVVAREEGAKMTVTILVPTVLFKIAPILAIMFIPLMSQVSELL